jgi:hypothetical protein
MCLEDDDWFTYLVVLLAVPRGVLLAFLAQVVLHGRVDEQFLSDRVAS